MGQNEKAVDIVVVAYNDLERLKRLAFSIYKNSDGHDYRLIIVDNSTEDLARPAFEKFKRTVVIREGTNLGWVGGVNRGWKECGAEYVVTMNDDIQVGPGWLDSLIGVLNTNTAAVAVPVATGGNRGSINFVRAFLKPNYPPYEKYTDFESCAKDVKEKFKEQFSLLRQPLSFYCFAAKRAVLLAIGPLDEQFANGGFDDDDYCKRVLEKGENIALVLDTVVFHEVSASGGGYGEHFENLKANEKKFKAKWGIPEKPKVIVAVPNMGFLRVDMVRLLYVLKDFKSDDYTVDVMDTKYTSEIAPVDRARNVIVKRFLEGDGDFLLMIDADIVPPDSVAAMCLHNKPVCAAVCFGWVSTMEEETGIVPVVMDFDEKTGLYKSAAGLDGKGVVGCDAVGTGCIMIRRDVLEKMPRPWFKFKFTDNYEIERGEDFYFCEKARAAGFTIHADKDRICDHFKLIQLKIAHEQQHKWLIRTREKIFERAQKMVNSRLAEFEEKIRFQNAIIRPGRIN